MLTVAQQALRFACNPLRVGADEQRRAGIDPFRQLAGFVDDWEFATCGMVVLEVCRGVRDPARLERFRERFA